MGVPHMFDVVAVLDAGTAGARDVGRRSANATLAALARQSRREMVRGDGHSQKKRILLRVECDVALPARNHKTACANRPERFY